MFRVYSLKEAKEWNTYLDLLPENQQDIYFSPSYYALYEAYGDGLAQCAVFEKNGDVLVYPFLKNKINELGYTLDNDYYDIQGAYGYNGFVSSSDDEAFVKEFYKRFDKYCKEENIIAEFTRFHPLLNNQKLVEKEMSVFFDRKTVSLNLMQEKEVIWDNCYSSKNRNMIRKARKNEIEVLETTKEDDYLEFFTLYEETMVNVAAKKHLFFNKSYILSFKSLLTNNHKLIMARYDNKIVGGMILMFYGDYAHYHLSARKSEYGRLALNNLFLDYAVDLAKNEGCKFFHFGGGTSSDEKDSLFRFKTGFSKRRSDFYIGRRVLNDDVYELVVKQWTAKNPQSFKENKKMLLGYREL